MKIYFSLTLLCLLCTATANRFFWSRSKKRDCQWAGWTGTECEKSDVPHEFWIRRTRMKIPKLHGGRECVGSYYRTKHCTASQYMTSTFLRSVTATGRKYFRTSAQLLPGASPSEIPKDTCPSLYDGNNVLRMAGMCRSPGSRRRRDAEETIDPNDKSAKDNINRVKRNPRSSKHRDLLFLVDESGSVGEFNLKIELKLASTLVSKFRGPIEVGESRTRVGLMTFDSEPHAHLNFDRYFERHEVINYINKKVPYTAGSSSSTCMSKALDYAIDNMFQSSRGARTGYRGPSPHESVVLLITDGCDTCGNSGQLKQTGQRLKRNDISIITYFIGNSSSCFENLRSLEDGSRCYQLFNVAHDWAEFDKQISYLETLQTVNDWEDVYSCEE